MTAAHLDRGEVKPVERQARIVSDTASSDWLPCGSVTFVEAAEKVAAFEYFKSKAKKLPKTLKIIVRDMERPEIEFTHEVHVSLNIEVKPLRGDDQ